MIDGLGANGAVAGYTTAAVACSLHTDDPGTTGAHEVVGGSPAYARKAITWTPGVPGSASSAVMAFDVPAATDVFWVALWDGSGNYLDKGEVAESFADQGVYEVDLTFLVE